MQDRTVNRLMLAICVSIPLASALYFVWYRSLFGLLFTIIMAYLFIYVFYYNWKMDWKMNHYECPKCLVSFQPTLAEYSVARKRKGHMKLKCPSCGFAIFMKALENDETHR